MKKLKLYSNYVDYFDFAFDLTGEPFIRFSTDFFSKRDQFRIMELNHIPTVTHGVVDHLVRYRNLPDCSKVIVYLDEMAHSANGKICITAEEALAKYPEKYASVVYGKEGFHIRILNIGDAQFELTYTSDDFFSNCGNVEITCSKRFHEPYIDQHPILGRNFWAIDFLTNGNEDFLACDFNTSPGLKGTGIEDILTPTQVVNLLKGITL